MDETRSDEADLPRSFREKQKALAAQLYADGVTEADVRGCLRWLRSQTWRTSGIDLGTVKSEVGKWISDKRPAAAAARASPNGRRNGLPTAADFAERARELEKQGL